MFSKLNYVETTSLTVQWLILCLSMQGVWVQSLAGQPKHQNILMKQKQYCNKFNKDFKSGPSQKNLLNIQIMHNLVSIH